MATVNVVNSRGKGGGGLRGALRYVSQDKKALLENGCKLVSGINCCPDTAYTEFLTTKRSFDKSGGRQFYHFTQSFHPDEDITPEQVHRIGLELAERRFPGYEVVVATHMDKEHLHSHLIVNSVSFESGKKLHQSLEDLRQHRVVSDEICLTHGLSILPPEPARNQAKGVQHREYRAAVRGDSWKFRLMNAIDYCMNRSRTRRNYLENMRRMGYGVTWSDTRKSITYTTPDGQKCRDYRLHEPKYLKESMQHEFEYRSAQRAEPRGTLEAGQALSTGGLRGAGGTMGSLHRLDAGQSAASAAVAGDAGADGQRIQSEPANTIDPILADGAVETGWEESRRLLENFERTGNIPAESIGQDVRNNQNLALDGLSVASDIARLARNLNEMSGEPEQALRPKPVHERKRGVGQKQDDHSGWQQELSH